MSVTIYHNPRCRKSREAIEHLNSAGTSFEIIEYLKNPPTKDELKNVIYKLGIKPEDLLRKGEVEYKENFKGKKLTNEECIEAMIKFPKLIERPIIINGNRAVIGRPPEKALEII